MDDSVFRRRLRILLILAVVSAAVLGGLQSAAMLLDYEDAVQLYYSGRVLPTVILILLAALTVLTVPACALLGKESSAGLEELLPPSGATAFAAAAGGSLVIASAVLAVPTLISSAQALGYKSIFSVLRIVTAVPGGLYLLMIGGRASKNSYRSVVTGSCLLVNIAMCIFTRYFVMDGPINSPPLVLGRLAQLAILLSLNYGLRFDCGMAKPRSWCAASVWAILFGSASCVSELARVIAGRMTFNADTVGVLARTAVVLYTIFRLADCTRAPSPKPATAPEKEETTHE